MVRKWPAVGNSVIPMPDEFIESAFRRESEILSYRKPRYSNRLSCLVDSRFVVCPDERLTISRFEPTLLENHTLYNLYAALGLPCDVLDVLPRGVWKICPACIRDDINEYGVAFIHRIWAFPRAKCCIKHGFKLQDKCPVCDVTAKRHHFIDYYKCSRRR